MTWFNDLPVQRKLGLAMLGTSVVVVVVACAVFLTVEYYGYRDSLAHTVATLARITADNSTAAIAFSDKHGATQNLEALRAEPQIVGAVLYDNDGEIFAQFAAMHAEGLKGSATEPAGVRLERGYIIGVQPVTENSRRLGTLYLRASMNQIYERMGTYALGVFGVLALSFALAWLIASMLGGILARPVLELATTAEAVSTRQNYTLRARQYGTDELGRLTVAFNAMLSKTQSAIAALQETEWSHRQLVQALPTAVYMCDVEGRITIYNEAAASLWGRSPQIGLESWCGSSKIYRPDGTPLPLDRCPMAMSLRGGRAIRGEEILIERPDGTQRNVMPCPELIRDTRGAIVGIVNMLIDITDQKRSDAAVRELAAIVESSDDAIIGKNLEGIITSWNRGAERLYGYTAAEIIGQPVTLLIPEDRNDEEAKILDRIRRDERIEHYETVRQCRDGTRIEISLTVSPIKDAMGKIIGASKNARDITERKRAERHVSFLSGLSQTLSRLEEPDEILGIASREVGQQVGVDRCFFGEIDVNVTGITIKADWAREGIASLGGSYPVGAFGAPEMWRDMAAKPLFISDRATYPPACNFGPHYDQLHIRAFATAPYLSDGRWTSVLVIACEKPRIWREDEIVLLENAAARVWPLIEEARGQHALRQSERRQRDLMQTLPVACYTIDARGCLTFFNEAAVKLWGRSPELGRTLWSGASAFAEPDGTPLLHENIPIAIALKEKRPIRGREVIVLRPDGSRRWTVHQPDPLVDPEGRCIGAINVVVDVTEERMAQERIQKVAEHLNLAIASANLGDWNWDATTDIITLSPRTSEIYGVPSEPKLTRSNMRKLLHEEDQERARLALQRAVETRTDYDIDYRVIRPDGTQRWVAAKGRSLFDGNGRVLGMVGVVQDITERKVQVEELEKLSKQIEAQAQLFDATLSNIADLAYYFDLKGRWIYANKPLLDLWGRTLEQITGKSCLELNYPPELAAKLEAQVQEVIRTKRPIRGETLYTSGTGKVDDHEYIFSPVINSAGGVTAVVGSTRLITERKRIEETLRQHEAQLRLVTDNAPVLLVRVNREYRFIFVNRAYAERNGFQPEEMTGMTVREVVGAAAYAVFEPQIARALDGERIEFELEAPYERIGPRWIHVILVPEKGPDGKITGLLGVISDIGTRKQAELELKRARDEAVAASRAKDDFLAALSHELRTPLTPVLLLTSAAANNPDLPPAIREDFDLIRKNVNLEARLIDDLLDLTRITRGKVHLELQQCDLHTILQDALANVRPELQEKRLQVSAALGADECIVWGDSIRLHQIFWNLLKNAVKFTHEYGKIVVETSRAAQQLTIKITDSGIGMTPEEIDRAFQAFAQGDHAAAGSKLHRFGGLGLGLAISRMLVELQAGRIYAYSAGRDQGSSFVVELPLWQGPSGERAGAQKTLGRPRSNNRHPSTASHGPSLVPKKGTQRRILLVEDHTPTRRTLLQLLKCWDFDVASSSSAAEAQRLAQAGDFDLVISDVGLPDRNGYDLMAALRLIKPGLVGIALSGYGMEEDLARSHAAGFSVHLVKPITVGKLEEAIARVLPSPDGVEKSEGDHG